MADDFLETVRDALEAPIDFQGQKLADSVYTGLLSLIGLLSIIMGMGTQNIYHVLWAGLAGTAFTFLVIVPPWPFFNRNPVRFLPSSKQGGVNVAVDGKKVS